jgi:hypothetical protein
MKKLISTAPGKVTTFETSGDDMHVVTRQKLDPILEANKRAANEWKPGGYQTGSYHHHKVADIPVTVYYDMLAKLGDPKHNLAAWKKWLNDSENRFFRTTAGKI